ncbi:MAG TPA: outer membrane lipoprotein-sorting protein [Myxococcota bacterium]|nr:outer membrane lipoprotein-sorting protein [Myxococcota bacterium]
MKSYVRLATAATAAAAAATAFLTAGAAPATAPRPAPRPAPAAAAPSAPAPKLSPAPAPAPAAPGGAAPDLETILKRLDDLYRAKSSISTVEMTVVTPKATRAMRAKSWTKGTDKALIVIEAPARDAGTATLKVGGNLWNYLPRIARTIRVPPSMMRGAWMGSDFTNDDLVRESSLREDFTARLAGPSAAPAGLLVELKAKPAVVGLWERIEFVVSSDGTLPLEGRYFDRKNALARTMTFDEVRDFAGRRVPARMTLVPADKPGSRTEMLYLDMKFDVDVPDGTFSLSTLESPR